MGAKMNMPSGEVKGIVKPKPLKPIKGQPANQAPKSFEKGAIRKALGLKDARSSEGVMARGKPTYINNSPNPKGANGAAASSFKKAAAMKLRMK